MSRDALSDEEKIMSAFRNSKFVFGLAVATTLGGGAFILGITGNLPANRFAMACLLSLLFGLFIYAHGLCVDQAEKRDED